MTDVMNEENVKAILDKHFDPLVENPASGAEAKKIRPRLKGIVVGVTLRGQRHYLQYGELPLCGEKSPPVPAKEADIKDHVLFIGSNTKVFTATMLALASIEEISIKGMPVNLDTPVQALLPEGVTICEPHGPILLWHLATHSSGFPDGQCPFRKGYKFGSYPFEFEGLFLDNFKQLYPPGTYWVYSNQAFGLLGVLLSHAFSNNTQKSKSWDESYKEWPKQVVSRITAPLGMNSTQVDYTSVETRVAQGYVRQKDGGFEEQPPPTWDLHSAGLAAGALSSTAEDMLIFLEKQLKPPDGTLGEAIKLTLQPCPAPGASNNLSMGLGWQIASQTPYWDRRYYDKNGGLGGYMSYMAFDPMREVGIVALGNTSGAGHPGDALNKAAQLALGGLRGLPAEDSDFPHPPKDKKPECPPNKSKMRHPTSDLRLPVKA